MLRKLDLFGIDFTLRTNNYAKFKRKTGGVFFLIYLMGIFLYFFYGIYDYFYFPNFETIYYEESFKGNEVNLFDQEFTFGIHDYNGNIRNKELEIN